MTSTSSRRADEAVTSSASIPLIAHVIYRLDVGGMENGLINLINNMPAERYRHAIVCLTEYTDFRKRLRRADVECYALHKRLGKDIPLYGRLWRLLRQLRPQIVHTRNLAALDSLVPAALAGVRHRVHGEHGRDITDLDGNNRKYQLLRRALRPFTHRYITVSRDLESWLHDRIGVPRDKLTQVYTGVDVQRFRVADGARASLPVPGFAGPDSLVIGTVGRMEPVKDPLNLARAFVRLVEQTPALRSRLRLVMIGDGVLYRETQQFLVQAGVRELTWLPGTRHDVPELLRAFDVFVLPSLAEGVSNTILEAMASSLPIVATRVGGSVELVIEGETGLLVPRADPDALARALRRYAEDRTTARRHGQAGRARVERGFSMEAMVRGYMAVYDVLLGVPTAGAR